MKTPLVLLIATKGFLAFVKFICPWLKKKVQFTIEAQIMEKIT